MNTISNKTIMINECFETIEEFNYIRMTNCFKKLNKRKFILLNNKSNFYTWIDRRHSTENVCFDINIDVGSDRSLTPLYSCQQTESSSGINVRAVFDETSFPIVN